MGTTVIHSNPLKTKVQRFYAALTTHKGIVLRLYKKRLSVEFLS